MARGLATWQLVKIMPLGCTMVPDPVHKEDMLPNSPFFRATIWTTDFMTLAITSRSGSSRPWLAIRFLRFW